MPREVLAERLAEADRIRALLRRATVEWQELGKRLLEERARGPDEITLLAGEFLNLPVKTRYADIRQRARGPGGAGR